MEPNSPAELTDAVRFDRRPAADDGYGNKEGEWAPLIAHRRAKLRPTRGGEQVIAARQQGTALFDLWVRFDSETRTVTPGDRVVDLADEAQTFNVKFVQDMTRRKRWLFVQLEQGTADG